jgi:hypothetical protein
MCTHTVLILRTSLTFQGPKDPCWPSPEIWNVFNLTLGGKLIKDTPPAISCYSGPQENLATCAALVTELTNSTFVGNSPVALGYPIQDQCPPVNYAAGGVPGNCSLGTLPRYTVDATNAVDVAAAVTFARRSNIRLVIRNTGHDLLGRYVRLCFKETKDLISAQIYRLWQSRSLDPPSTARNHFSESVHCLR